VELLVQEPRTEAGLPVVRFSSGRSSGMCKVETGLVSTGCEVLMPFAHPPSTLAAGAEHLDLPVTLNPRHSDPGPVWNKKSPFQILIRKSMPVASGPFPQENKQ
jgi:hypothetical protein